MCPINQDFSSSFDVQNFQILTTSFFADSDTMLNNGSDNMTNNDSKITDTEGDKEKIDQSQQTTPTSPNTGVYIQ